MNSSNIRLSSRNEIYLHTVTRMKFYCWKVAPARMLQVCQLATRGPTQWWQKLFFFKWYKPPMWLTQPTLSHLTQVNTTSYHQVGCGHHLCLPITTFFSGFHTLRSVGAEKASIDEEMKQSRCFILNLINTELNWWMYEWWDCCQKTFFICQNRINKSDHHC